MNLTHEKQLEKTVDKLRDQVQRCKVRLNGTRDTLEEAKRFGDLILYIDELLAELKVEGG